VTVPISEGLPSSWSWATLGELLRVVRGVTYKKAESRGSPGPGLVPILRATNIREGVLTFDDPVYVPGTRVSQDQVLCEGDIVVAASSGSKAVVGKAASLTRRWKGSFGAFCFALRPLRGVHAPYLAWFLQTPGYRRLVGELSAGISINNLRRQHLETLRIPIAPLPEQRRIVEAIETQLTRLDTAVAALKRIKANLKRYRASVLKAACEGRLVPIEAEIARAEGRGVRDR